VTNGLFISSYPAPGVQVIPGIFRAGIYGYLLPCLVPVSAILWFGIILHVLNLRQTWAVLGLLISISGLLFVLSLVRKFKLEIKIDGVSYTSPFRGSSFVAYSEISSVLLIDYRHLRSEATPRRSIRSFTMMITPNVETGKSPIKIPLTLFPDAAHAELVRLFRPEEWESGA
jgi:hypothetical protein